MSKLHLTGPRTTQSEESVGLTELGGDWTGRDVRRKCRSTGQDAVDNAKIHETRRLTFRATLLTPFENAYLEMIEADGRLDRAAAAFGYLFTVDAERTDQLQRPSSVLSDTFLLNETKNALISDDGSPAALMKAALALATDPHHRWIWAVELYLLAALTLLTDNGGGGGPEEATCLFAIGRFYATAYTGSGDRPETLSMRFLEWARRASDGHRLDWLLPGHLLLEQHGHEEKRLWAAVCTAEHEGLSRAARKLDPSRAIRAVQAASRLADLCGLDDRRRAEAAYELGARYTAVGEPDRAVEAFERCAEIAARLQDAAGLDLKARLEAVRTVLDRADDDVLKRLADDAADRRDNGTLMRTMAARGRLAAYCNRPNDAYLYSALAVEMNDGDDDDPDVDSARLHAAVGQTCVFLQANFWSLNEVRFDLLTESGLWTEHHHGHNDVTRQTVVRGEHYGDGGDDDDDDGGGEVGDEYNDEIIIGFVEEHRQEDCDLSSI